MLQRTGSVADMRLNSREVLIATKNKGKVKEFEVLFAPLGIKVQSLHDVKGVPDIIEDGDTFAANALKKARVVSEALQIPVIADDSGLCVDALKGKPGVYSARYAGEDATDAANNLKLMQKLQELKLTPLRLENDEQTISEIRLLSTARFVCAMALVDAASGLSVQVEGKVEGMITDAPRGEQGFGYDPLFYVPHFGRTMAQLSMEEKNKISHRGEAMRGLIGKLEN